MTKVTVLCLTYNHAPYIEAALQGFVNQITDFDYIALIGDDASTDGTSEIVRRYATEYPSRIIPIIRPRNIGGIANSRDLWSRVTTEYVITCEGDDYWLDKLLLQKGVDFLDDHPECPMFCSNSLVHDLVSGETHPFVRANSDGWFSLAAGHVIFPHISTRLMRYQRRRPIMDVFQFFYFASLGPCYFQNEMVSTYNLTGHGYWSSLSEKEQRRYNLAALATLNKFFNYRYDRHFTKAILAGRWWGKQLITLKEIMTPQKFWTLYRLAAGCSKDIELMWTDDPKGNQN